MVVPALGIGLIYSRITVIGGRASNTKRVNDLGMFARDIGVNHALDVAPHGRKGIGPWEKEASHGRNGL
jgi:hypothetical protein